MKQNQRYQKPLSVLLCLAMLLSLFVPFAAFAEGDAERVDTEAGTIVNDGRVITVIDLRKRFGCRDKQRKTPQYGVKIHQLDRGLS